MNGKSRKSQLSAIVLVVVSLAQACSDPTGAVLDTQIPSRTRIAPSAPQNIDEAFLAISDRVPSFSGAYFDRDGTPTVAVTDLADSSEALAELNQLLVQRVRVNERYVSQEDRDAIARPKRWRFSVARISFRKLFEARSQLRDRIFDDPDVVSLDIDERAARLVIGVRTQEAEARVSDKYLTSTSSVPVAFSEVGDLKPTSRSGSSYSTVFFRRRPITGGYEIGPSGCTLTIGARRGSEQLILTNSHCTNTPFGLDGGAIAQPSSGPLFGAEVTDPGTYGCGTLFAPRRCRRADIAAFSAAGVDLFPEDTLGWAPGLIARTTWAASGLSQTSGSKEVDQANPQWNVVAEILYPVSGEMVNKVGIATGWTNGAVYATCVDVRLNTFGRPLIVCSDKANLYMQSGDSGAPVFALYGGYPNTVAFYGAGFASDGGSSGVFSNLGQIRQDLGNVLIF